MQTETEHSEKILLGCHSFLSHSVLSLEVDSPVFLMLFKPPFQLYQSPMGINLLTPLRAVPTATASVSKVKPSVGTKGLGPALSAHQGSEPGAVPQAQCQM